MFGRQDHHSEGHIAGVRLLPPLLSIPQNPGKTLVLAVLAVLPAVAALVTVVQTEQNTDCSKGQDLENAPFIP